MRMRHGLRIGVCMVATLASFGQAPLVKALADDTTSGMGEVARPVPLNEKSRPFSVWPDAPLPVNACQPLLAIVFGAP